MSTRHADRGGRLRAAATSIAAIALGLGVGVSAGTVTHVEPTSADYVDRIKNRANLVAEWPNSGWAKQTSSAYTNLDAAGNLTFPLRGNEKLQQDTGAYISLPASGTTPVSLTYTDAGTSNFGPSNFGLADSRARNSMRACAQTAAITTTTVYTDNCTGGSTPAYPHPGTSGSVNTVPTARAKGFGLSSVIANPSSSGDPINWIVSGNVSTSDECFQDGTSYAAAPTSPVRLRSTDTLTPSVNDLADVVITPQVNKTLTGWVQPVDSTYRSKSPDYWRFSITSRSFTAAGYALSDLSVQVDIFRISDKKYLGTHESVISRSECGVSTPLRPRVPLAKTFRPVSIPAFPSTTPTLAPGSSYTTVDATMPDPATGAVATSATARMMRVPATITETPSTEASATSTTASTPVTTTGTASTPSTSPSTGTAAVTTTSAPPTTGGTVTGTAPSTTSTTGTPTPGTSATPAPTVTTVPVVTETVTPAPTTTSAPVPTEPGPLSTSEPTVIAGNVDISKAAGTTTFVDALAKGSTAPDDRVDGVLALGAWINEQRQTTGWKAFTSTNPTADGWKWAVISQTTGTVLYIR